MAKNLVVVESPAKAKTIGKILGADFEVKASMGHVRDLPIKKFGVNIGKNFEPEYAVVPGRKELVAGLRKAASSCETIYLAPDPDREGEAIAWHLQCLLGRGAGKNITFRRVTYNEITPKAVREAFANPREIDMKLVCSQQARRIVDRIVGYRVSPLLWTRVKRGLSAGRVQSVALRLICAREREILAFVPQAYWLLAAKVRKLVDPTDPFLVRLSKVNGEKADIRSAEDANRILEDLKGRSLRVSSLQTRDISRKAPPPFITSTLQQAMSSRFGLSASSTMRLAQRLYEGIDIAGETVGLITYMRTDSFTVSQDAITACRGLIGSKYGPEYVPEKPNFYKSRESSQGAHEAIRPTDVNLTPDSVARHLPPAELKVYRCIWERFMASQMAPASIRQISAEVAAEPPAGSTSVYTFRASSSVVTFPGYMKVAGGAEVTPPEKGKEEADEIQPLPPLTEGEIIECTDWLSDRKETQPPARYTEGSLVKELEQNGVGRPSTYAQILSTLTWRKYIVKDKRSLVPTPLGLQVNDFLVASLSELFDVAFTANMELELDKIEDGSVEWTMMIREFYEKFMVWFDKAKGPPADIGKVRVILGILSCVKNWVPGDTSRKKPYSDEQFVKSLIEQVEKPDKVVSMRQVAALARIGIRYEAEAPGIRNAIVDTGFTEAEWEEASRKPDEQTLRKLSLLDAVRCDEPSTRGKKIYDDRDFIRSLAKRTAEGRDLSPAQKVQVDRLVMKYSAQIPDFDVIKSDLGLAILSVPLDEECAAIIDLMKNVTDWRPATKRGNKEFSDREFFESLKNQFERKRMLSPRQKAVLRRVAMAYRNQIPGFDAVAARFEWKSGGKRGATTEPLPESGQGG
ncbi:MAG: type I DNA topoisomerase [bacterium]